jgi:hypothetical protein
MHVAERGGRRDRCGPGFVIQPIQANRKICAKRQESISRQRGLADRAGKMASRAIKKPEQAKGGDIYAV